MASNNNDESSHPWLNLREYELPEPEDSQDEESLLLQDDVRIEVHCHS